MVDRNLFAWSLALCAAAQVLMILTGHYLQPVRGVWLWLGLVIDAAAAGGLAWRAGPSWTWALASGLVVAIAGSAVSIGLGVLMGDLGPWAVAVATTLGGVAGLFGAMIGKLIR